MSARQVDVRMWKDALTGIPRVDRERWAALDLFGRWLIAIRAAVLVMTLLAVAISGIFAYQHGLMNWPRFWMVAVGLLAAHATNNILNDLSDHRRGVDKDNAFRTRYGTQPVEEGFISPRQSRALAIVTVVPALATAAWLTMLVGKALVPFALAGLVLVFAYNWPLKHFGLGEPTVIVVWGPLMVGGGYLSITGVWSWAVAWASLPYAIGATIVLFGKHIDKIPWDKPRGVRTLPVLMGHQRARQAVLGLVVIQFLLVGGLLFVGTLHWPVLLVLGSLPFLRKLVPVYRAPTPKNPPEGYPHGVWPLWYSAHGFVHCRNFGLLYISGLLLSLIWV
ncbi:MAG: prenyltransferase [Myxococcota bacterium]|nr:prenyltransferase [Myxococcota bacterium]